jgi:nitrate reductase gamma subunit
MMYFIGQILPYIAVTVFIAGVTYRVMTWLKTPVPFQITIFPAPETSGGRAAALAKELLLFSSLRRGDTTLWFWAWIMHICLAMIIAGHAVGIYFLTHQFTLIGMSEAASSQLSATLGIIAGVGFILALVALLYRRISIPEVRRLSDPADYFDIALLLAVLVTGMMMRAPGVHVDLVSIREYIGSLIMLSPKNIQLDSLFVIHFFLINVLLIYFPFSKLIHMAGFFVSRSMLLEAAPVYPTPQGTMRDARVLKRRSAK